MVVVELRPAPTDERTPVTTGTTARGRSLHPNLCSSTLGTLRMSNNALAAIGAPMAKVSPYHSSDPTDPDVYHDHDDCPSGQ